MNELLAKIIVIDAHGGMERWNGHEKVDATIRGLFPLKAKRRAYTRGPDTPADPGNADGYRALRH